MRELVLQTLTYPLQGFKIERIADAFWPIHLLPLFHQINHSNENLHPSHFAHFTIRRYVLFD
jgi:hypothetical protein